jgi:signal transduction histidine kinase
MKKNLSGNSAILDQVPEGIIRLGKKDDISFVNETAANLLGYKPGELSGQSFTKIFKPEGVTGVFKVPQKIQKQSPYYQLMMRSKDDAQLMITGYFSQVDSLTSDRVFIFHELKPRVSKEESDFLSMASHQLRTPLTVASLYTDMLRTGHLGALTDEQLNAVEEISFYHQKITDSLSAFLVASKIELGTYEVLPQPTEVVPIIDEALRLAIAKARHHKVKLKKRFTKKPPKAMMDADVLKIVLNNLISNAIKFSEIGGTVELSLEVSKNKVKLSVKDNGAGIPPEDQSRIFEKMFRGNNMSGEKTSGIGFGLYVARELIKRCDANIAFTSKPGQGTVFTVAMPVAA